MMRSVDARFRALMDQMAGEWLMRLVVTPALRRCIREIDSRL